VKTILFVNFPVSGHINPQYEICKELASENHVIYLTAERYKQKYEDIPNLTVAAYPAEFMEFYDELLKQSVLSEKFMALLYVFYSLTDKVIDFAMEYIGQLKPDLIVCDALALWGKMAARYYNIPCALFFASFMGDTNFLRKSPTFLFGMMKSICLDFGYIQKFSKIKKNMEKKYGDVVDGMSNMMSHQGLFSIVHTSEQFHPYGDQYPDNVHFLRPSMFSETKIVGKRDTIFIGIGTIASSDNFWDVCLDATRKLNYRVVISFGNNPHNKVNKAKLRQNVEIYDNLSLERYREELMRSEIFINHGGFNGVMDGIIAETKMLIYPKTVETKNNGKIIEDFGCGKVYPKGEFLAEKLEKEIEELLNMDCKENLWKLKESFINSETCFDVAASLRKEYHI